MVRFTPKLISLLKNGYGIADFRCDILAGLTVAIVALPLSMAFAIASGASPEQGIITAIIAGFLISLLGGSRVQIGGPTGAFVVILYGVIGQHGYEGLVIATFLAGLILIVAGYAKLGECIKFIPQPVITGFTAGIAVIIASSQIKDFFGLKIAQVPADFVEKWKEYFFHAYSVDVCSIIIGLFTLCAIYLLRKWMPKLPRYLIALIFSAVIVQILSLNVATIGSRFPTISAGVPLPTWPEISLNSIKELLPSACTIAFLAGIEALLSAIVADGMTGYSHRPNQELVAQGIANCSSAVFGGLAATGAIARTATNIAAGGKTPMAGIFHSLFLLGFILFAADSMKFIPMPALAAVLFFVAWQMSDAHRFIRTLRFSVSDRMVLILTFFLTVFIDLTVAIAAGVILAAILFMVRMSKTVKIASQCIQQKDWAEKFTNEVLVFTISGPIFFGVAKEIAELVKTIQQETKVIVLQMQFVPFLDKTGFAALDDLVKQCRVKKITLIYTTLQSQPKQILSKLHPKMEWNHVSYVSNDVEAMCLAEQTIGKNALK